MPIWPHDLVYCGNFHLTLFFLSLDLFKLTTVIAEVRSLCSFTETRQKLFNHCPLTPTIHS